MLRHLVANVQSPFEILVGPLGDFFWLGSMVGLAGAGLPGCRLPRFTWRRQFRLREVRLAILVIALVLASLPALAAAVQWLITPPRLGGFYVG